MQINKAMHTNIIVKGKKYKLGSFHSSPNNLKVPHHSSKFAGLFTISIMENIYKQIFFF